MHQARSRLLGGAIVALLVAACSSSATPTPAPNGGGNGGGASQPAGNGATQAPGNGSGASQPAGNGGGGSGAVQHAAGWDRYGKAAYAVSGPASFNNELGFVPAGSVFGDGQVSLSYYDDTSTTILALRWDGTNLYAQYGDSSSTFVSESCRTSGTQFGPATASGQFDCTGALITATGAMIQNARMQGSFSAKAS